MSSEGERRTFE